MHFSNPARERISAGNRGALRNGTQPSSRRRAVHTVDGNTTEHLAAHAFWFCVALYWFLEVATASSEVDQYLYMLYIYIYAYNSSRIPLPVDEEAIKTFI